MGAIALQACATDGPGREDVATVRLRTLACEKAEECGCESFLEGCDDWRAYEPPEGLAFDPACVERWNAWVEEQTCASPSVPQLTDLCPLYHGTIYEGMPCETGMFGPDTLFATDCARGLYCINQVCRDPARVNFGAADEPCGFGPCDEGLFCSETGVCEPLPGSGEPCPERQCGSGLLCQSDVCVAEPGPGERCVQGRCRSDSYCTNAGQCERAGLIGEICFGHAECMSRNCPAGRCQAPATAGDPCSGRLPCGPGHECNQGVCEAISETNPDGDTTCQLIGTLLP